MVSVIMPVYNGLAYLSESVESVLAQKVELELIVVDDGSTDGTGAYLDELTDDRVKVIHQENGGVSRARNKGLSHARGEYIAFVDADDTIEPDFLERMLSYDADLVISDRRLKEERYYQKEELFSFDSHRVIWGVLYRSAVIEGLSFRNDLRIGEDTLFLSEAILKSQTIFATPKEGYCYRENAGGTYFASFSEKKFDELKAQRAVMHLLSNELALLERSKGAYGRLCYDFLSKYYPQIEKTERKRLISDLKKYIGYAIKFHERDEIKMRICSISPSLYFGLKYKLK